MRNEQRKVGRIIRRVAVILLVVGLPLALTGCSGNVGVGVNVGVPIGSHGYMSVGTSRWY